MVFGVCVCVFTIINKTNSAYAYINFSFITMDFLKNLINRRRLYSYINFINFIIYCYAKKQGHSVNYENSVFQQHLSNEFG